MALMSESRWDLTGETLQHLLQRLHADPEHAARAYESLRVRLIAFFDWRGLAWPETAADETLDRVARRLLEGEEVVQVEAYAHGVARLIALERLRRQQREQQALSLRAGGAPADGVSGQPDEERVACLSRCLGELPPDGRALILDYYEGAGVQHLEGRKRLAQRLGLTYTTLKTRAHRLRVRLEACLRDCMGTPGGS
jgi:DNA-directed RNA polymerase specialized sigma24 family protein